MSLKLAFDLYQKITRSGLFCSELLVERRAGVFKEGTVEYTLTGSLVQLTPDQQSHLALA